MNERLYEGIDKDPKGAMNPTGNIIRDAWVFGLIPETETCEGWNMSGIEALYEKVTQAWNPMPTSPRGCRLNYWNATSGFIQPRWNMQET